MKKSVVALLHIGFWLCYLILLIVILGAYFGSKGDVQESRIEYYFQILLMFAIVPSAISFYSEKNQLTFIKLKTLIHQNKKYDYYSGQDIILNFISVRILG